MSPFLNSKTLLIVGFLLLLCQVICSTDNITEKCEAECKGIKSEFAENSERNGCNITCRTEQCSSGCKLWNKPSNSSCVDSCGNPAQNNGADICARSCTRAIRIYISELRKEFKGNPGLDFMSRTNVSILLRWAENRLLSLAPGFTFTYLLQKFVLGFSDDWQFHESVNWLPLHRISVFDLKPYVTYKFRIVVVMAGDIFEPLPESNPIATQPSGTPLQAPEVVSLSATSTSVHLKAKPPFFVNGPLIGFKLTVSRSKRYTDARIKEIITHGNSTISEVITMLQPDTEYELRLAAINRYGVGPELFKTVRTRSQNLAQSSGYLLFCVDNKLLKQDLLDIFKDPEVVFEVPDETVLLTEIAIHYAYQLTFVATNDGHLYRISANGSAGTALNVSSSVAALTVDWLHDYLYMASENTIFKCDLSMDSCSEAVELNNSTVIDMHVDPCNGYLYWTQKGLKNGLFSLDLDSVKAFSMESSAIVVGSVAAFAIDYLNYRLFYSNETVDSIISVYLDGTDPVNIRTNTLNPDFSSVTSLAYNHVNYTFYWTDGEKLMMEVYDVDHDSYHHNQMPEEGHLYGAVEVWGTGAQPIPVPILPPRSLQALLTQTSAVISWLPPESDQGKGAWQKWLYEIEALNVDTGTNRSLSKINSTKIEIENLEPGSLYSFRVCGTSVGGIGPWSEYFMAHTLTAENTSGHVLYYVSNDGLFEKSLDGLETRHVMNLNFSGDEIITGLNSFGGTTYLTARSGEIYEKPGQQSDRRTLEIKDVGIVAFDWLTNRLYWTNTKLNLIKRMLLKKDVATFRSAGKEEIVVYASSVVQDLVLDVTEARMYWTTSSTVETAYLDGQNHLVVQKLSSFASQYILGMAVDLHNRFLFWMVKNVDKLIVCEIKLVSLDEEADVQFSIRHVVEFPGRMMLPSLDFLSNKLFWMGPKNMISVLDLKSLSIAQLQLVAENKTQITAFKITAPSDRETILWSNRTSLNIIPEVLNSNSVLITEFGNYLNISWNRHSVGVERVYYRVFMQVDGFHRQEMTVFSPFIVLKDLRFYSEIEMNLTACSYWGCGIHVQKTFHSLLAEKSMQGRLTFALSTSLGVILAVTMIIICVLFIVCLGQKNRKIIFSVFDLTPSAQSGDHELATLTHLPAVALQTTNVLYASSFLPGNEEIACLPHFPHCQLWLTKFLGSGAFGKVFEGIAVNILDENSGETRVAVKTLHKSASDNEKEEFLKEALLMNNFKHDHILRLLGVCLNHDPQFLILELMDGGDLLTFLRASRPSFVTDVKLTTSDMIGICMDVGKGCEYLEDMHFVHRDLAARNCLISFAGSSLVVKIGDFGLARDIYRNDYYKKEGEGLLPVRWMSPESLIDGIFTTQSDVWAYGVLMWEVITLGQQPYPAQTNLEVLHFVRSGGRLDCPENCPNDLYHLMLKCWLYLPLKRPSFHDIVKQLKTLSEVLDASSTASSSDAGSPTEYDMPSNILHHHQRRQGQRKSRYGSEDYDSRSCSGQFSDQRELTIFDPISLNACATDHCSTGCTRSSAACHSGCDDRSSSSCGYLQPSRRQSDRHPKYLELISSTNSSQEDS